MEEGVKSERKNGGGDELSGSLERREWKVSLAKRRTSLSC
jgi:hypothetical protein